ncbi:MAG: hypothetical protein WBD95_15775 [Xanthobacteraceae bacterium]
MSYALKNFDLATLDWLLQSDGVNPIATGANDFLIARGDTKGVTDTTDLIGCSERNAAVSDLAAWQRSPAKRPVE